MSDPHIAAIRAFNGSLGGDGKEAIAVLDAHPELFQDHASLVSLIHGAALMGHGRAVAELLRRGAPVNAVRSGLLPHRPIVSAVVANSVEAVRAFLEYGSEVNWGFEVREAGTGKLINSSPVCPIPLQHAIMKDNFEIIRLLVEAGSLLNAVDNTGRTILNHALRGDPEVVEYLRSKGAKLAQELP